MDKYSEALKDAQEKLELAEKKAADVSKGGIHSVTIPAPCFFTPSFSHHCECRKRQFRGGGVGFTPTLCLVNNHVHNHLQVCPKKVRLAVKLILILNSIHSQANL